MDAAELAAEVARKRNQLGIDPDAPPDEVEVLNPFQARLAKLDAEGIENPKAIERERRERVEAQRAVVDHAAAALASFGRRYADATLDNFEPPNAAAVAALARVKEWAEQPIEQLGNVFLFGAVGTGKDHLIVGLVKRIYERQYSEAFRFAECEQLFADIRSTYDRDSKRKESEIVEPLVLAPFLYLADVVPSHGTLKDYQQSALSRIVDARYRDLLPTWATANVASRGDLDAAIGKRVSDRLIHGALVIKCNWPSYRKMG